MRAFAVALLLLASCRQTMTINTESSAAIPSEVAVAKLQELLPTVDFVECRSPKAKIDHKELKEWKIDAISVGFHGQENAHYRFRYSEIRRTEFTRITAGSQPIFEVALFIPDEDRETTDLFRFNWLDEARARKALELIEALRRK